MACVHVAPVGRIHLDWSSKLQPGDIRDCDLEELTDTLLGLGYTWDEINRNFPLHLQLAAGLWDENAMTFSIVENRRFVYMATLSAGHGGTCIIRGFAVHDHGLSRKVITLAVRRIWKSIEEELRKRGTDLAICHVKSNNTETLTMWQNLQRNATMDISISQSPYGPNYKLITVYDTKAADVKHLGPGSNGVGLDANEE